MKQQASVREKVCWTVLVVVGICVFAAFGQTRPNGSSGRAAGQRDDVRKQIERRAAAARRSRLPAYMDMINKQADETDEDYQARLRLTIRGLIRQQSGSSIPSKRANETTAAYKRRVQVASMALRARGFAQIARPGEEEDAYFTRVTGQKEGQTMAVPPRRVNESQASYQARVRAAREENRAHQSSASD